MNDEAALLRAVVASPEEARPALVYADWLDEQGDAQRAEFIRLQCHMAKQVVPDTDARLRSYDLLDAHKHLWFKDFPESEELRACSFRNGFVSKVKSQTLEAFRGLATALQGTTSRQACVEEEEGHLPPDWPQWSEMAGMTGLEFASWEFGLPEMSLFAESPHISSLRSLAITYSGFDNDSMSVLASSPRFANVRHLDLTNHLLSADGVRTLAHSPVLHSLQTLELGHDELTGPDHNRFHTDAVVALSQASSLRHLSRLSLCPYELTTKACAAVAESVYLTGLRSLSLSCRWDFDAKLSPLLGSPALTGLELLDLGNLPLSTEEVVALVRSPRPSRLRILVLSVDRCGIKGVEALLGSPWAVGLHELALTTSAAASLRDPDAPSPLLALKGADSLSQLRELWLGQIHLGDEELAAVAGCELPRLISLHLGYCRSLTSAGWHAFAVAPGLSNFRRLHFAGSGLGGLLVAGLIGTPLASQLVAVNLQGQRLSGFDVLPFLNRGQWPNLIRLEIGANDAQWGTNDLDVEIREALRRCWGSAVRLDERWAQYNWYD